MVYGLRYDIRTGSALQLGIGFAQANLERLIVDPFVPVAERISGPVDQKVSFAEIDLQLNLTGGKTWHRLAPFVGVGGGLTFAGSTPADTSGFKLGRKIYFAPHAGFRFFVTDRLHLRGDARVLFWKLNYPPSFTEESTLDPDSPPVIDDGRVSEWSTHVLAPGRPGLFVLPGSGMPVSLTRTVGFRAVHRLYRPEWSEGRNREVVRPAERSARTPARLPVRGHRLRAGRRDEGHGDGSG